MLPIAWDAPARGALGHPESEQGQERTHLKELVRVEVGKILLAECLARVIGEAHLDLLTLRFSALQGWSFALVLKTARYRSALDPALG
jgi:hypothetical protein